MDNDDREYDKKIKLLPTRIPSKAGRPRQGVSLDVLKSAYIARGMSAEEIAEEYKLDVNKIKSIVEENKLPELRQAYIRKGIEDIQNTQIHRIQTALALEDVSKNLRLMQLEDLLKNYTAYYARHGDLYKRHPVTGDILKDNDGFPLPIHIPNVARELQHLKESATISEGVKGMLNCIDEIINRGQARETLHDEDIVNIETYDALFRRTEDNE